MYAKIMITGELEVMTGLHIGAGGDYAAIGAADAVTVKDVVTGMPVIPGSSLKGKLRSLLAKTHNKGGRSNKTHNDDAIEIIKLFGGVQSEKSNGDKEKTKKPEIFPSKLIFSDMFLKNMDELNKWNVSIPTEIKFENTIDRMTATANPRQIERIIRQSKFDIDIIYNVSDDCNIISDIELLAEGFNLLKYDYLGGNGSRGYGKVNIHNLSAEFVIGNDDGELDDILDECNKALREVNADEV